MKTYFKDKLNNWHSLEPVETTELVTMIDNVPDRLKEQIQKQIDAGVFKKEYVKVDATDEVKTLLDSKIELDLTAVDLISITAHISGDDVKGIINYRNSGQHVQLRF
jgi:hypothetical protein